MPSAVRCNQEMTSYYHHNRPFELECGVTLPQLDVAYHTFGSMNADRSNVVWVCHALTANSDVADWWPHTVEQGCFLDPDKWFVVCANILGSHYWFGTFPAVTIRDMVRAHALLADALGVGHIHTLVGSSVGGFQAVEWAVADPSRFGQLVLIATDAKASPWTIAIDETQRMAILADSTYGEPRPDAGMAGLAAARAIGLLTYRGGEGYNRTQADHPDTPEGEHRACTYQRYQGEKLCCRFNAYSYMSILNAFDTHDVGYCRGGVEEALARITARTLVVGLTTDMIFTTSDMRRLAAAIGGARYAEISSPFGHDGFLVEHVQLNALLGGFMGEPECGSDGDGENIVAAMRVANKE